MQMDSTQLQWPGLSTRTIKSQLHNATKLFSELGLYASAKWTSELCLSIGDEGSTTTTTTNKQEETRSTEGIEMLLKEMGEKERDTFEVAKSYFNLKEFHRAAHALLSFSHPKSLFLRRYSLFLVGAKKREEELNESTTEKNVINEACKVLEQELRTEHNTPNHNMDPLNLYLYGLVLKELNLKERAIKVLIEGLNKYPLNWSCWTEVSTLLADNTSIPDPLSYFNNGIKEHWMKRIFLANLQLELQHNKEALTLYDSIATLFPASTFILSQRASISYNMQDFDTAKDIYSKLFAVDPYRLEDIDTYSNILFVKEEKAQLSFLAHAAWMIDKYRPETCCVIGNYYSTKNEHEKAVLYFKRALKLNRNYLAAWTLIGHEYLEMKNSKAAIQAYRMATVHNQREYRAWYGLGLSYEMLKMHVYSLYYYHKATSIRPYDSRMWCALGNCYEQLDKVAEAIKCYERAYSTNDTEGTAINRLAALNKKQGNMSAAAIYYEKDLDLKEKLGVEGQQTVEALLFLARYWKDLNHLDKAEKYCLSLLDFAGPEKEEAKAYLHEIYAVRTQLNK